MQIEKIELVVDRNLHFETEYILVLWYKSLKDMHNAEWKPSIEWRKQQVIQHIDGSVTVTYDKRDLGI